MALPGLEYLDCGQLAYSACAAIMYGAINPRLRLRQLDFRLNVTNLALLNALVTTASTSLTCLRLGGNFNYADLSWANLWLQLGPVLDTLTEFQWDPRLPNTWGMYEEVINNYIPDCSYLSNLPNVVKLDLGSRCVAPGTLVDTFAGYPHIEELVMHLAVPVPPRYEYQDHLEYDQWRSSEAVQDIATFVLLAPSLRRLQLVPEWLEPQHKDVKSKCQWSKKQMDGMRKAATENGVELAFE